MLDTAAALGQAVLILSSNIIVAGLLALRVSWKSSQVLREALLLEGLLFLSAFLIVVAAQTQYSGLQNVIKLRNRGLLSQPCLGE